MAEWTTKRTFSGIRIKMFGTMTGIHYISSTLKGGSQTTMRTATKFLLLFILLLPLTSALEFSLISPKEANLNEEFSVSIEIDSQETYDVKIYVTDDVKAFSEIYNGNEWKSTHYYLLSALPEQEEFKLLAHQEGETKICAKLRKQGSTPTEEKCNDIKIIQAEKTKETPKEETLKEESPNPEKTQTTNQESLVKQNLKIEEPRQPEKIILSSPIESLKEEPQTYRTKQEKTRLGIIYGFSIFTIIIIVLLALRKL